MYLKLNIPKLISVVTVMLAIPLLMLSRTVHASDRPQNSSEFFVAQVELNQLYVLPSDSRVSILFTELPQNPGNLSVNTVNLSERQRISIQAESNVGYEFNTNMENGTFRYKMTLPSNGSSTAVKYSDDISGLNQEGLGIEFGIVNESTIEIESDHFTIFVVTDDSATYTGGTWNEQNSRGSDLDATLGVHYPIFTNSGETATWDMAGLGSGSYDVFVSWTTHANRSQSVQYTIDNGTTQNFTVNQELLADQSTTGASGEFSGWYKLGNFSLDGSSSVYLTTNDNTSGTEYVVADDILVVNGSSTASFVGSPKYTRESNASDISAQLHIDNRVDDVRFYANGGAPIAGTYVNAVNGSTDRWRLFTPLSAGEYTITAEFQIAGEWYTVDGNSKLYVLDLPWFEYTYPTTDQFLRPGDNPVRVRLDDEFSQFESVSFNLYDYSAGTRGSLLGNFQVLRSACDLRQAGNYVICDINDSTTWSSLGEGRYQADASSDTLANNGVRYTHANSDSESFYIDSTAPTIDSLMIDTVISPYTVYSDELTVTANASDTAPGEVKHVEFYLRTPRASDGACVDNNTAGTIIKLMNTSNDGDDSYTHTFDTSDLNGEYCVFAKAEDLAASHSGAESFKLNFDNEAPVVQITNPADGDYIRGSVDIRANYIDENPLRYYLVVRNSSNSVVAGPGTVNVSVALTDQSIFTLDTTTLTDGEYTIYIAARDAAGNRDNSAGSEDSITVYVDNTAPVINSVEMFVNGSLSRYAKSGDTVTISVDATDNFAISSSNNSWVWIANFDFNWSNASPLRIDSGAFSFNSSTNRYEYSFVMPSQYLDGTDITTGFEDQYFNGRMFDEAGNQTWFSSERFTYYLPGSITGRKYRDVNMNGQFDTAEKNAAGDVNRLNNWSIDLFDNSWNLLATHITGDATTNGVAMQKGQYTFTDLIPGTYYVCEQLPVTGWIQTSPSVDGVLDDVVGSDSRVGSIYNASAADGTYCYTVELSEAGDDIGSVRFGNVDTGSIVGRKILDVDGDGQLYDQTIDDSLRLDGWVINLYDSAWNLQSTQTTGSPLPGQYVFDELRPATYYVCEEIQNGWYQSYPYLSAVIEDVNGDVVAEGLGVANQSGNTDEAEYCWEVQIGAGEDQTNVRFGNSEYASLTFYKEVIDEAGTDITDDSEFSITLNTIETKTFSESVLAEFTNLRAGDYTFNELVSADYNLVECYEGNRTSRSSDPLSGAITIAPGNNLEIVCINELIELPDVEVTPASDAIVTGEAIELNAVILSPGTPDYTLSWTCLNSSDVQVGDVTTGDTKTVSFSAVGEYRCEVTITDGNGDTDKATATLTVSPAVPDRNPQVVLYGSSPATNSGGTIYVRANTTFNVVASLSKAGNPNYDYQFGGVCSGSSTTSRSSVSSNSMSLSAGSYICTVEVRDTDGDVDRAGVLIVVSSQNNSNVGSSGEVLGESTEEPDGTTETDQDQGSEDPEGSVLGASCESNVKFTGYVVIDADNTETRTDSDTGVSGMTIRLYNQDTELIRTYGTDSDGSWEASVCPGTYVIQIVDTDIPDTNPLIGESSQTIDISGDEIVEFVLRAEVDGNSSSDYTLLILILLLLALAGGTGTYMYSGKQKEQDNSFKL